RDSVFPLVNEALHSRSNRAESLDLEEVCDEFIGRSAARRNTGYISSCPIIVNCKLWSSPVTDWIFVLSFIMQNMHAA
ncbi:hypothetical protein L9F63_011693, partial [Diploptera punctata]